MRPYIVCHMMTSADGRIDCDMTAQLKGVDEYYSTLDALDTPTVLSGRVTAMLELALEGEFQPTNYEPYGKENFSKKKDAASSGYEIVVDTKGVLLWKNDEEYDAHHLIITSEKVSKEYISYLDSKNISWIVCGKDKIDLAKAVEILAEKFGVNRMSIVGGGHINGGFLDAGLIDEVSLLIGAGIDGREGMAAVFDGLPMDRKPIPLKLKSVQSYDSGAVWIRYLVK